VSLPEPMSPPDADLQDFPFMPLHVARLRDSDLAAEEDPEACWYAVLLWASAWHQLPAGSLPDNDTVLMRLVGLGRDHKTWKRHRDGALRGFVKCSDGRLYHPVIAEQVIAGWRGKLEQRHRTECARIKKHNQRNAESSGVQLDVPTFDEWLSRRHEASVPEDTPPMSPRTAPFVPEETASKGKGERKGQGQGQYIEEPAIPSLEIKSQPSRARTHEGSTDAASCLNEICIAARWHPRTDEARIEAISVINGWLAKGFELDLVLAGIGRALATKPGKTSSLKRFTTTIQGIHEDRGGTVNGSQARPAMAESDEIALGVRKLTAAIGSRLSAQ
jgi:hypothetical protein